MVTNKFRGDNYIAQGKLLRVLEVAAYLMGGKRTVSDMAERFDISERTAYRYLQLIDSIGTNIESDFEGRHFISEGCPLCELAGRASEAGASLVHH